MTAFGDAFKEARSAGKKTFTFNGKKYTTATKDDNKTTADKNRVTPKTRSEKSAPTPRPASERPGAKKPAVQAKSNVSAADKVRTYGAKKNAERAAVTKLNSGPNSRSRTERLKERGGRQTGGGF